ncbi:MAG: hypothetical protein Kow00124_00550 [Anaerolineae bacterium]
MSEAPLSRWDVFAVISLLLCVGLIALGLVVRDWLFVWLGGLTIAFLLVWWLGPRVHLPRREQRLRQQGEAAWQPWREMADRLGLSYVMRETRPYRPDLSGTYRDHAVLLTTFQGRDDNTTRIHVMVDNPSGVGLRFWRKPNRAGQVEDRFIISSQPPGLTEWLLASARVRQALETIPPGSSQIWLQGGTMEYLQVGLEYDTEYLETILDLMVDIARMVEARPRLG